MAKMGVPFTVYDHDTIEGHNVPNQLLFGAADIGEEKARKLGRRLMDFTAYASPQPVTRMFRPRDLEGYDTVVMAVDTLGMRRALWETIRDHNRRWGNPLRVVDLRMGGQTACVYTLWRTPNTDFHPEAMVRYAATLVEGSADVDECGNQSFAPTAMIVGGFAGQVLAALARGDAVPSEIYWSGDYLAVPAIVLGQPFCPAPRDAPIAA
jgi:molybdopterin/thiamine biosynthesis adenylyltransferase